MFTGIPAEVMHDSTGFNTIRPDSTRFDRIRHELEKRALLHIRERTDADALAAGVGAFERCGFLEAGFVQVELALAGELVDITVV